MGNPNIDYFNISNYFNCLFNKMRKFYVTIQLSNGGIESLFIDLNEGELATDEMFADKIEEWWHMNCKYMSDSDKYIESHIIAWSQIETE